MKPKTKLDLKHEDQAKMNKSRRAAARYMASPEYAEHKAMIDEFRAIWQRELAEIEAILASF